MSAPGPDQPQQPGATPTGPVPPPSVVPGQSAPGYSAQGYGGSGYGAQGYAAQGYAAPGYGPPVRTNVLAIVTLVLSLVGVSIGAVITGHISLSQIRKTAEQGRGMALAGLIIGYVGCAFWIIGALFFILALVVPLMYIGTFGTGGTVGTGIGSAAVLLGAA